MNSKYLVLMAGALMFVSTAHADCSEGVDSCGTCGEGCTWAKVGTALTVIGTGNHPTMTDYDKITDSMGQLSTTAPWGNDITSVNFIGNLENIGTYAFRGSNLTSVTIPDSITSIGRTAFYSNNLTSVIIGDSVTSIGMNVFLNNPDLSSIIIGDAVNSIGKSTFSGISSNAKIYCHDTTENRCIDLINENNRDHVSQVVLFEKEGSLYKIKDEQGNYTYFASADGMAKGMYVTKNKDGSITYFDADGKFLRFSGKRIYTVDEANTVAGKKNRITIRYK